MTEPCAGKALPLGSACHTARLCARPPYCPHTLRVKAQLDAPQKAVAPEWREMRAGPLPAEARFQVFRAGPEADGSTAGGRLRELSPDGFPA